VNWLAPGLRAVPGFQKVVVCGGGDEADVVGAGPPSDVACDDFRGNTVQGSAELVGQNDLQPARQHVVLDDRHGLRKTQPVALPVRQLRGLSEHHECVVESGQAQQPKHLAKRSTGEAIDKWPVVNRGQVIET